MTINYVINEQTKDKTIERYLLEQGYSQSLIRHLRNTENAITTGGVPVYTTHKLVSEEVLTITFPEEKNSEHIVPSQMPLHILFEDEHLMVIDKEAGVPIHPSQGNFDNTLANGLAYYFLKKKVPFTFRAINRLDRDTTGLLIIAKNPLSACILSDMVKKHEIQRRYLAIAHGKLPSEGIIDAPIARVTGSTIERCVDPVHGEWARTRYQCLSYDPVTDHSLVKLRLETGRTHQIRVHLKSIGHPLPGDFLYNPDYRYIKRQALHSFRLDFQHPITKASLSFQATIPADMQFINIPSTEGLWDNDF